MRQLKISKQITNRDSQSLEKYLQEIGKLDLMTASEEVEVAKLVRRGDRRAFEKLVNSNLRFVVSVAKQYQNQGLTLSDLINEGNLGLIKAAQRFDETRGFKFISYAVWWIRQSILQALAEQSRIVRIPLNKISSATKINKTFNKLEQQYQREPTPEEMGEILEMTPKLIRETMKVSGTHLSMDAPLRNDGEGGNMYEVLTSASEIRPDTELLNDSLRHEINRSLASLEFREAEVIRYYFGLDGRSTFSLEEISEEMGLTRERVRQIKEKSIKKLKTKNRNHLLKGYL